MNERICGACHECCIYTPVAALNKPAGTPCEKLLPVIQPCGACSIYADRPSECAAYKCSWLDGTLPEALKPDACGILFETATIKWPKPLHLVVGFENRAGAVAEFEQQLDAAAVGGIVIGVVPFDKSSDVLYFGDRDDLEAWSLFMENARRSGGVTHQFADGIVEQSLSESEG